MEVEVRFTPAEIEGAFIVDLEPHSDERGFFARVFCRDELERRGLNPLVAQVNMTFTARKGTIRGLHYQVAPAAETKLIRCTRGAIYEVIVDLRPDSPSYLRHLGVELTADNRRALYVPELCAAGAQALTDGAEALYHVSGAYTPDCERGVRYDDSAFGINWPLAVSSLSAKDAAWEPFTPLAIGSNHAHRR
jgi:dTDP-4-dehydrorhamnose 3,5-epimerase